MLCRGGFDIYHLSFCLCRSALAVEYIYISESDSWHHLWRVSKKMMRFECPRPEQCSQGWPGQVILRLSRFSSKLFLSFSLYVFNRKKHILTFGKHQRGLVMEKWLMWFTRTFLVLSVPHNTEGWNFAFYQRHQCRMVVSYYFAVQWTEHG